MENPYACGCSSEAGATSARRAQVPSPLPDGTLPGLGLCVSTGPGQAGALAAWMTATESAVLADTLLGLLAARLHAQADAAPEDYGGPPNANRGWVC